MELSIMKNSANTTATETPAPLHNFYYPNRRRVVSNTTGPSRTRQEFRDECDINRILSNYQRTGALQHFAKYSGSYGDFTACDYQTAQNLIIRARQLFDELPSSIKKEVSTPEGFLTFVQDPKNADKMREYGLTNAPTPSPAAPSAPPEGAKA